ncbi:MAG: SRPBCC family protein [Myxococcota bacterium]
MTTTIERSIEVGVPAATAYDTWTQFELFPHFMDGVQSVEQSDDRHLHWKATILGVHEEWDAEITEQIPDKRTAWRSTSGASNAGVVTFHRLADDRSKVMLQMEYEPERFTEKVGDVIGVLGDRVQDDLARFKKFVEQQGDRVRGWRGTIPSKDDASARSQA